MPVEHTGNSTVITGAAIGGLRASVIKKGIEMYLKHGIKVNSAYTRKNMLSAAKDFTGKTYKQSKNGLQAALDDLTALCAGKTLDEIGAKETR